MKGLEHWHPVALSAEVDESPCMVRLHEVELVLFRTAQGHVGAFEDRCPHRRMRLSEGRVQGERLVCAYHGWNYAVDGTGQSPGTPQLQVCADHYEVREIHGAIWVKRPESSAVFPSFDVEGFEYVDTQAYSINAPFELVLDNFTEVEHTGCTHAMLGYDTARMDEVTVEIEPGEESVRVKNQGPQKPLSWMIERLFGIRSGDIFVDDWTTWFSPVYTQYEHQWIDPRTKEYRPEHLRSFVFFVPEDHEHTRLFVVAYARTTRWGEFVRNLLVKPVMCRMLTLEVELDIAMIERIADKNPDLEGMRLSRFDRVLGLNRARIASIYRGETETTET